MRERRLIPGLLALARVIHAQILPYNPTRIFLPVNSSYAYILGPSSQSYDGAQLSALNLGDTFDSTSLQLSTISSSLPFLKNGERIPYTPTMDASGNITVIAGQCNDGSKDAGVWQFQPDLQSSSAQGSWTQHKTAFQAIADDENYVSPGYLSNSITYSNGINGHATDSSIYFFGGMCPFKNATVATWISRADYSDAMLTVSPGASNFDIGMIASRESPISQAGFSITPLPATYGLDSTGATDTQQQDFVLLGGNTQTAFINMSQVALFSLPQQSWSFIDVSQPASGRTDLTRSAVQEITPRSGHTAVFSESTNSIIIFGGWVGDVNTPAQPQLAVLELGEGYGGTGDWKWTVPDQSGLDIISRSGIYGHGATMLPGGVMLVLGGYEIAPSPSRWRRRSTQVSSSRAFLYNTTSQSWLKSYDPSLALKQESTKGSGPLQTTGQKVGLGTGLAFGAALLVTVVVLYVWYGKRLQKQRDERERTLLAYSSDGSTVGHADQPFLTGGADRRSAEEAAVGRHWPTREMSENDYPRPLPMQHSTGAFINFPSPTRGLRKSSGGRTYQYHTPPQFDDKGLIRGSGNIHPIAEDENEDDHKYLTDGDVERTLFEIERVLNSNDPFSDPDPSPLRSHPLPGTPGDTVRRVPTHISQMTNSLRRPRSRGVDMANWTAEEDADGAGMDEQDGGLALVNGDDRTSSTLSESSRYSTTTNGSISRPMTARTEALLAAAGTAHALHSSPQSSPTRERSRTAPNQGSVKAGYFNKPRTRSSTNGSVPLSPGEDGDSFVTVKSHLLTHQTESDALLQGRMVRGLDDPYLRAVAAHPSVRNAPPQNLYHAGPPRPANPPRRRPGLMGSLRRALNVVSIGDRSFSLTGTGEQYEEGMRTTSSSPTKDPAGGKIVPRRAISDGGTTLLRQKRGQKDWDEKEWPPYRDDPAGGDWGEQLPPRSSADMRQAEEDWDVEGAATNRDFQVMFSVPKSRLRVVNDDMDRASLRSASDGALSRNGSIRRDGSIRAQLKVRKEGEGLRLPSTEEETDGVGEKFKAR